MDEEVEAIFWSDSALLSFDKIIKYLSENWTDKEIEKLVLRTNEVLNTLKCYPEMFPPSVKRINVRIAMLNKQTKMVYYYKSGSRRIQILLFWGMKQDPKKFKY